MKKPSRLNQDTQLQEVAVLWIEVVLCFAALAAIIAAYWENRQLNRELRTLHGAAATGQNAAWVERGRQEMAQFQQLAQEIQALQVQLNTTFFGEPDPNDRQWGCPLEREQGSNAGLRGDKAFDQAWGEFFDWNEDAFTPQERERYLVFKALNHHLLTHPGIPLRLVPSNN